MLTFQWLLTGAALVVAAAALIKARRLAKRLERLAVYEVRIVSEVIQIDIADRACGACAVDAVILQKNAKPQTPAATIIAMTAAGRICLSKNIRPINAKWPSETARYCLTPSKLRIMFTSSPTGPIIYFIS